VCYAIAGGVLASNVVLPELRPADAAGADWSFHLIDGDLPCKLDGPFHEWRGPDGRRHAEFLRAQDSIVLRFPGVADFVVTRRTHSIACHTHGDPSLADVRPTLINQVLPLVFALDRLVLHAGAVQHPRGALAFVGPAAAGKSTLAAALARRGAPFICDDGLILDQSSPRTCAVPAQVPLRLWMDSARTILPGADDLARVGPRSDKRLLPLTRLGAAEAGAAVPLHRIYVLDDAGAAPSAVDPMPPSAAAVALLRCSFQIDVHDRHVCRRTLSAIGRAISEVRPRRLRVARDFAQLNATLDLIERDSAS
jgi:hypothetical protein